MKPNTKNPAILNLIDQFSKLYGCTWDDLLKKSRKDWLVECRYLLMYFLHRKYLLSFALIARLFDLDRTTVMHGISKIANQISSDVNFAEYIERMDSLLDINFDVQVESVE